MSARFLSRHFALAGTLVAALIVATLSLLVGGISAATGSNGKIAFQSTRDGNGGEELYVMNADGSQQTRLTFT
jgi:hypothetical protein